jgi:glycosyltransferase involved in cell wall biosynthesis
MGLGGAQSALLDLLEAKHPELMATVIVLRDRDTPEVRLRLERAGVPLERARLALTRPHGLRTLHRAVLHRRPDIVHAHLEWSCHLAGPLILSLGRERPRLVLQTDNDPRSYAPLHRWVVRRLALHADAHIVPGPSIALALEKLVGQPIPELTIIPLGLCPDRFAARHADQDEVARLRAGASVVVGAVGRLVPQKRMSVLLRAMHSLLSEAPGLRLLVVGSGSLRQSLEREAALLGLSGSVHFTGARSDLATVYAALDMLILPSAYEGQGLVLLEAMAARVPIVATSVCGIADVILDEETGLLVPSDDPASLASAILRLLRDDGLRQGLVTRGLQVSKGRYGRQRMAEETERLYQRLLACPGP